MILYFQDAQNVDLLTLDLTVSYLNDFVEKGVYVHVCVCMCVCVCVHVCVHVCVYLLPLKEILENELTTQEHVFTLHL